MKNPEVTDVMFSCSGQYLLYVFTNSSHDLLYAAQLCLRRLDATELVG